MVLPQTPTSDTAAPSASRDTPLWRLPEAAEALTEASDKWSNGPAAALGPLRRANRLLHASGHAERALRGERLVQAIAEAAYGQPALTDTLRNALREFEREVWRAGVNVDPVEATVAAADAVAGWDGAPNAGELQMAGWVVARPRLAPLSSSTAPLRADVERVLLRLLRPDADANDTTAALGELANLAADLHRVGGSAPLDYWRLAAAWLRFARAPLSLPAKRMIGRMNLALRRQLAGPTDVGAAPIATQGIPMGATPASQPGTPSGTPVTATPAGNAGSNAGKVPTDVPGLDLLESLAIWHAQAPDTWLGTLLADFGVLRRRAAVPAALAGASAEVGDKPAAGASARDWLRIGPLSVRQDVCQAYLSLADEALPNLSDPVVAGQVADYSAAIGLAPVARLAAAVAATGERLAASPPMEAGGPAALAMTVKSLRGMLHQFAGDTYPEARPDLIAEMAMWRERALDASGFTRRLATGRDVP